MPFYKKNLEEINLQKFKDSKLEGLQAIKIVINNAKEMADLIAMLNWTGCEVKQLELIVGEDDADKAKAVYQNFCEYLKKDKKIKTLIVSVPYIGSGQYDGHFDVAHCLGDNQTIELFEIQYPKVEGERERERNLSIDAVRKLSAQVKSSASTSSLVMLNVVAKTGVFLPPDHLSLIQQGLSDICAINATKVQKYLSKILDSASLGDTAVLKWILDRVATSTGSEFKGKLAELNGQAGSLLSAQSYRESYLELEESLRVADVSQQLKCCQQVINSFKLGNFSSQLNNLERQLNAKSLQFSQEERIQLAEITDAIIKSLRVEFLKRLKDYVPGIPVACAMAAEFLEHYPGNLLQEKERKRWIKSHQEEWVSNILWATLRYFQAGEVCRKDLQRMCQQLLDLHGARVDKTLGGRLLEWHELEKQLQQACRTRPNQDDQPAQIKKLHNIYALTLIKFNRLQDERSNDGAMLTETVMARLVQFLEISVLISQLLIDEQTSEIAIYLQAELKKLWQQFVNNFSKNPNYPHLKNSALFDTSPIQQRDNRKLLGLLQCQVLSGAQADPVGKIAQLLLGLKSFLGVTQLLRSDTPFLVSCLQLTLTKLVSLLEENKDTINVNLLNQALEKDLTMSQSAVDFNLNWITGLLKNRDNLGVNLKDETDDNYLLRIRKIIKEIFKKANTMGQSLVASMQASKMFASELTADERPPDAAVKPPIKLTNN